MQEGKSVDAYEEGNEERYDALKKRWMALDGGIENYPRPEGEPFDPDMAFAEFVDDTGGYLDDVEDYIKECERFVKTDKN
jgi:hypothetical protein